MPSLKFQFGQYVFEMSAEAYLKDWRDEDRKIDTCYFELNSSKDTVLEPKNRRFLMGNSFLKHFYSVYDYDDQTVKLGVNIHSENVVKIEKYTEDLWQNNVSAEIIPKVKGEIGY